MEHHLGAVVATAFVVATLAVTPQASGAIKNATASTTTAATTNAADARFKSIYTREWTWRVAQGLARAEGDHGLSPTLARADAAAQETRRVYWAAILKELDAIKPATLSRAEQINYAVYRAQIAALHDALHYREYEQPVNADTAFWTDVTYSARRPLGGAEDYRNYLAQLAALPRYFDEEVGNMRAGLARGFTPPRVTLTGRDSTLVSVAEAKSPQDTVFYTPFKQMPASIPAAEQEALRAQALQLIGDKVQPAHAKVLAFFRNEYVPNARTTLAAEAMPGGKAYYQSKIVEFTTTNLTADQIHAIGLSEMAKIRAEMHEVMRKVDFKGDLAAFLQFLRTDPQFYAKSARELLMATCRAAALRSCRCRTTRPRSGPPAAAAPAPTGSTPTTCRRAPSTACRH
jgi:uncharacterized protein (DUF885 family)